jgi:hypothetical protein
MSTMMFFTTVETEDGDVEVGLPQTPGGLDVVEFEHPISGRIYRLDEAGSRGWNNATHLVRKSVAQGKILDRNKTTT